jgi:hypothetical protein
MKNRHMFGKSSIINRPSTNKINYVPGSGVGATSYSTNRRKNIDAVNTMRNNIESVNKVYIRETYTIPEGTTLTLNTLESSNELKDKDVVNYGTIAITAAVLRNYNNLTNYGTIINNAFIINNTGGIINNNGFIINNGAIINEGSFSNKNSGIITIDAGSIYIYFRSIFYNYGLIDGSYGAIFIDTRETVNLGNMTGSNIIYV